MVVVVVVGVELDFFFAVREMQVMVTMAMLVIVLMPSVRGEPRGERALRFFYGVRPPLVAPLRHHLRGATCDAGGGEEGEGAGV